MSAVCPICKDAIPGCPGGDACPLVTEVQENMRIFEDGALGTIPLVNHVLPPFFRVGCTPALCEALVGISTAPAGGTVAELSNRETYPTPTSIVRAARFGHCSVEEAVLELSARIEEADDQELSRMKAAMEMVKVVGGNVLYGIKGVYTFIWAKTGQILTKATEAIRLSTSSAAHRLSSSDLTVTLRRPATEAEFYERLHYYAWILAALGIAHISLIMKSVSEAVYEPKRRLGLTFSVCHELFLVYLDRIESDVSRRLNLGNIFEQGMFDTMLTQAKANEVICFRTRGENPRPGSATDVTWNGKYNESSQQPCMAYNKGTDHTSKSLDADGACKFNHVCMQWVSDKGPRGICGGKHPKGQCTYDAALKLDGPRK